MEEDKEGASRAATSRKRPRVPRDYRLPSPVGQVDTPGTPRPPSSPVPPPPSESHPLFLLTSSSPLSTSIRVLNTRRKRKTARRPRHWLDSLYYTSSRRETRLCIQGVLASPLVLLYTTPLTDFERTSWRKCRAAMSWPFKFANHVEETTNVTI